MGLRVAGLMNVWDLGFEGSVEVTSLFFIDHPSTPKAL